MDCPRCGTEMYVDTEIDLDDGKPPIVIYVCPNCRTSTHTG